MFGRFLSFLGFIPGLSGLSGLAGYSSGMGGGSGGEDGLDADGEAAVSFTPGKALASADSGETPDSRRERITDRDLVWPGKVETIQISNPEQIAYRFDLTVTDLNPAFYIRRPPQGGVPQREGGVLLQPGDGATFEVVFVPPPAGEKLKTRTFGFVLTCFDPRRSSDPGEIVQDLPLRWVGLPTESDLQITAVPPVVVTRPWRREAKFAVRFANKSFLPPTVGMTILRAPTKDALEREAETVGTIEQSLAARTPGVWQCLLPPSARRGSYFATVRGAAQAADSVSTPLALPRPVLVRYVPWLRMGRDWATLLGMLLLLIFVFFGVPAPRKPEVRVTLHFDKLEKGKMPLDTHPKDLTAQMILLDENGRDQGGSPIPGTVNDNTYDFIDHTHFYGFYWFGPHSIPNFFCRKPQRVRIELKVADDAMKHAFKLYDLNNLQPDDKMDTKPSFSAADLTSFSGPLVKYVTFKVPTVDVINVSLQVDQLTALARKGLENVSVEYKLDNQEQTPTMVKKTFPLVFDAKGHLRPILLPLTNQVPPGDTIMFTVVKVTAGSFSSNEEAPIELHRRSQSIPIPLSFHKDSPQASSNPTTGAGPGGQSASVPPAPSPTPQGQSAESGPKPPVGGTPGGGSSVGSIKGALPGSTHPHTPTPVHTPGSGPTAGVIPSHPSGSGTPAGLFPLQPPGLIPPKPQFQQTTKIAPLPLGQPPAPTNLTSTADGPYQINVRWDSVPGATKYLLYHSGGPGGGISPRTCYGTSFSSTGLTPGATYIYHVQSKRGTRSSGYSNATSTTTDPATVKLTVSPDSKNVHARLDFTNLSSYTVYLDKVNACANGKIGAKVFTIVENGQPVEFKGKQAKRPRNPGSDQFIQLFPGSSLFYEVNLNSSYRFQAGHDYSITYSAEHKAGIQDTFLTSTPVSVTTTR